MRTGLHYLYNWAQDDRAQQAFDNLTTREIHEDYIKDGHITVLGWDATVHNAVWGYLGAGASYIQGENAFPLKGLSTFGGEGNNLTDRWWGPSSEGNGKLLALGLNYNTSLGRMLRPSYSADAPDVAINAGFVMAYTLTNDAKSGRAPPTPARPTPTSSIIACATSSALESIYTFRSWVGVALRADRVAPNSKDSE